MKGRDGSPLPSAELSRGEKASCIYFWLETQGALERGQ